MNLKEFIQYRQKCPICDYNLCTFFHSEKQQSVKYEEDRLVVIFRLAGLRKHEIHYKVGYSFGLEDSSWQIEFYNQDGIRFEKDSPFHLMNKFKELDKNLGAYKFYRSCTSCRRYNYSSNQFKLQYKSGKIISLSSWYGNPPLVLAMEYIGMTLPLDKEFKIYKLLNDHLSSKSTLVYGRCGDEKIARDDWGMHNPPLDNLDIIQTNLIKFSSKEETMTRLNKLIIFS